MPQKTSRGKSSSSARAKDKEQPPPTADKLERRRPAEQSPQKKTPSTVTSAPLRPCSILQEPGRFDAGAGLHFDAAQQRLRFGELVDTVCIPCAGEKQAADFDQESEEQGPTGLRWVNVGELFECLSGRLLCTQCGTCDLDPHPEEQQRSLGSVFNFYCSQCEEDTFSLCTQKGIRLGKRGPPTQEAAVRLAAHALRTGGGYASVQSLCADMNMPAPSYTGFHLAMEHASKAFV
jgi:hypothetical protein